MKKNSHRFKPLISIIMNCHNGEKFLNQSIKSIINQTYKKWELIFWDNKSIDNSKKILKQLKDKRISYFYSKKFLSLYHARNLAIKKAKGKYICFLDVDDYWSKDKLKKQVNYILKNSNYKIIYSNYFLRDENKKRIYVRYKKENLPFGFITQILLNDYTVGILTIMVDKKVFKFYKFKKIYNIIGDFDFIIRASLKFKIGCLQIPLAYYRIHSFNFSKKKIDLHIKELKHWVSSNQSLFKKFSLSSSALNTLILKLKIKNYTKFLGV